MKGHKTLAFVLVIVAFLGISTVSYRFIGHSGMRPCAVQAGQPGEMPSNDDSMAMLEKAVSSQREQIKKMRKEVAKLDG